MRKENRRNQEGERGKGELGQGEGKAGSYCDESAIKKIQWGMGQAFLSQRRLIELRLE